MNITKDMRNNWHGQDYIAIAGGRSLCITTLKVHSGHLVSLIQAGHARQTSMGTAFEYTMYQDWAHRAFCERPGRCTEPVVSSQHARAIALAKSMIAEVELHYAKEPA